MPASTIWRRRGCSGARAALHIEPPARYDPNRGLTAARNRAPVDFLDG